jgi:hypothetical protein
MAWWLIVLIGLGVVLGAVGVLAASVAWESRHIVRHMAVEFGQPFAANMKLGAAINSFYFIIEKREDGKELGAAKFRDTIHEPWTHVRMPLADFPLELAHHRVNRLGDDRFAIVPIPCSDEEFLRKPELGIPKLGPSFRGVKIAAPSAIKWAEGVEQRASVPFVDLKSPLIPIACAYMISSEELGRDASDRDLAVHIRIDGKDRVLDLEDARRELHHRKYGIDETVYHPAPGPELDVPAPPLKGRAAGSTFTLDIGSWLEPHELPNVVAVVVECAGARSNEVTIQLEP